MGLNPNQGGRGGRVEPKVGGGWQSGVGTKYWGEGE